jgi:hypothetical protein
MAKGSTKMCVSQEMRKQGRLRQGWRDDVEEAMETRDVAEEGTYRGEDWRMGAEERR